MVLGVNLDVLFAQIAAVAEPARFARAKVHGNRMLGLGDDLAGFGRVEFLRRSVLKNRHWTELARELLRVQFHPDRADRTYNPAPVGVAAVDGALDQRVIRDCAAGSCRVGLGRCAVDHDLEHSRCSFGIERHLPGQVLAQLAQDGRESPVPRAPARDRAIARKPGGEDYRSVVGALVAVNGQLVQGIVDGARKSAFKQRFAYGGIGGHKAQRGRHVRRDHARALDRAGYRHRRSGDLKLANCLLRLGVGRHYRFGEIQPGPPSSMVFEPPGRFGTLRTLPEMNMAYLCQIPVDDPKNLIGIIYGFLRGAARLTDKGWGTSIYGQVDRADASWFLTHAYDLGAQHFFFWDTARLACVPYSECLALARNLQAHAESHPHRDLKKLRQAAEVAILLPPGYNLGHVYMGKGNLWGLGELHLERMNREGVKYRRVMGNFFTEIERCIRMGIAYDLLWDIEGHRVTGYRRIVRVREDGKVEVIGDGKSTLHDGPRIPDRPEGVPPQLTVELSNDTGKAPLQIAARASLVKGSADIFYTLGANSRGTYRNVMVLWELYGPEDEDYRFLLSESREPRILVEGGRTEVEMRFTIRQPGIYRLRAATVDMAGRTTVVWKNIVVED